MDLKDIFDLHVHVNFHDVISSVLYNNFIFIQFEKLVSAVLASMRTVDVFKSGLTPIFNQK